MSIQYDTIRRKQLADDLKKRRELERDRMRRNKEDQHADLVEQMNRQQLMASIKKEPLRMHLKPQSEEDKQF